MMELLAPAGGMEAFEAAVKAGADAVYIGGSAFNARQYAGNFDDENLKRTLDYAHLRGVKVYVTVNTLIRDDEFGMLLPYLEMLYTFGADGIIVQDMGVAAMIRRYFPDMPLHASTQMTVHNAAGAVKLRQLGFKRVVPARELSLDEIAHMVKTCGLEIEVFVHGAMCYAYSGQCLMSSFMGGRSGNRGRCAQPCRMCYGLEDEGGTICSPQYLLSMKDLCLIDDLPALASAGVAALKIEGRMKSPEYVATVVSKYRKALDRMAAGIKPLIENEDRMQLMQAFNRGGFSKGYIYGKTGIDMICPEKPDNWGIFLGAARSYDKRRHILTIKIEAPLSLGDGIEIRYKDHDQGQIVTYMECQNRPIRSAAVGQEIALRVDDLVPNGALVYKTSDAVMDKELKEWLKTAQRYVSIKGRVVMRQGQRPIIEVWDDDGHYVRYQGQQDVQAAQHMPLTKERVLEQVNRVGDLPFRFDSLEVELSPDAWMPISAINALRRQALEQLAKERIEGYRRHKPSADALSSSTVLHDTGSERPKGLPIMYVMLDRPDDVDTAIEAGAGGIYLRMNARQAESDKAMQAVRRCRDVGIPVIWALPRITHDAALADIKEALTSTSGLYDGVLASDIGQIKCALDAKVKHIYGDFSLNIFNRRAAAAYAELGLERFMPSLELTLEQLKTLIIGSPMPVELMAHGRLPLMVAQGCPIGAVRGGFTSETPCSRPCLRGQYELRDRKGERFPIRAYVERHGCYIEILNAHVLCMVDKMGDLLSTCPSAIRLDLRGYHHNDIQRIVKAYRAALDGHNDMGISVCDKAITRGHYYKGVL